MYIKGFDKDLKCRGFQFEVGKVYDTGYTEGLELCSNTVFHFCDSLDKVHEYYSCIDEENRYCEIEVLGELIYNGNKCGSNKIKILREITGEELDNLKGHKNGNTGLFNIGRNNSGYANSGDNNSGNCNSGDKNSGYLNSGNANSGDCNSGDNNSGNANSGDWNKCDGSNGIFCTEEPTIRIFDKDTGMTLNEFRKSKYGKALRSVKLKLTEWIKYTEEEMKENKNKRLIGGYLKEYSYKEACANWWDSMTDENKEIIKSIPNFDKDKFEDITGIRIE